MKPGDVINTPVGDFVQVTEYTPCWYCESSYCEVVRADTRALAHLEPLCRMFLELTPEEFLQRAAAHEAARRAAN